ncbi:hypothetical protein CRT23_25040 [Methylobacterium sp. V23]|nr:hypothetical protein CRT23_25040 [Methylobacterium sp. V23]
MNLDAMRRLGACDLSSPAQGNAIAAIELPAYLFTAESLLRFQMVKEPLALLSRFQVDPGFGGPCCS